MKFFTTDFEILKYKIILNKVRKHSKYFELQISASIPPFSNQKTIKSLLLLKKGELFFTLKYLIVKADHYLCLQSKGEGGGFVTYKGVRFYEHSQSLLY